MNSASFREQFSDSVARKGPETEREEPPCIGLAVWEISRVTTICTAEKNRLTVRGVRNGARYLVKKESNGWWIEPAPQPRRRIREVKAATRDLSDHLEALADDGFAFEPLPQKKVPPCRF